MAGMKLEDGGPGFLGVLQVFSSMFMSIYKSCFVFYEEYKFRSKLIVLWS